MFDIARLRERNAHATIIFGDHPGIIQSVLDFDFLLGRENPSIIAIVGVNRSSVRYFFGGQEIRIAGYVSLNTVPVADRDRASLFAVAQSGRRAAGAAQEALEKLPNVVGGMIFAEGVPEKHAIALRNIARENKKFVLGPASVGMALGGSLKLGAIGGTMPDQIQNSGVLIAGETAVVSTSGGMVNEIIAMVGKSGSGISFACAVGGERFPVTKPVDVVRAALADTATKNVLFFGELGGTDEYEVAELLKESQTGKKVIAYIAGVVAEHFESAPQFGHAKALAQNRQETATAKKQALADAGATVASSFAEFEELIASLDSGESAPSDHAKLPILQNRHGSMFHSNITSDNGGEVRVLDEPLVDYITPRSFAAVITGMLLGHNPQSPKTVEFIELCLKLLVDHGPQVSGAVNVMITARAGRDLPSALSAGLLTIGDRFGGAINEAAVNWLQAIESNETPAAFVERYALQKVYIPGIGHKKYRLESPDPRVEALFSKFGNSGRYVQFAQGVAAITTTKKSQLILNVDGAIAAMLLDVLSSEEQYSADQLRTVIRTELGNAIFVLARSIGFTAHFLDQKRLDEGLFRLPDSDVSRLG